MRSRLNIYSNNSINSFMKSFLVHYDLILNRLESIDYKIENKHANIIIINNKKNFNLVNFNALNDNYLIISSLKLNNINLQKNINIIDTPVPINHLKNKIENFVQNIKIQFHDLSIDNEKLINLTNDSFCYLTKVELEILTYLIREKETSKNFIKQNILNIKTNIETNSLESHLTRIRKKMNKVKTTVKIQTKSEKLLITI